MGRTQQTGVSASKPGTQSYANSTRRTQRPPKTVDADTALSLGLVYHSRTRCLSGITGLQGLAQPSSLDPLPGATGLNPLPGGTGLNTGLSTNN